MILAQLKGLMSKSGNSSISSTTNKGYTVHWGKKVSDYPAILQGLPLGNYDMKGNKTLKLHVHCEKESKKTEITVCEWVLTVYLYATAEKKYLNTWENQC